MAQPTARDILEGVQHRAASVGFSLKLYEQLFIGEPTTSRPDLEAKYDTMQRTAPTFFGVLRDVLRDYVFLGLAVLCDRAKTRVKGVERDNLSFARLIEEVEAVTAGDASKSAEVAGIRSNYTDFLVACDSIEQHRNKRIGHADAAVGLDPTQRLPDVSVAELRDACQKAFRLANRIEAILEPGHSTSYHNPILTGDGDSIIHGLRSGMQLGELEIFLWEQDLSGMSAGHLRKTIMDRFIRPQRSSNPA